MNTYSKRVRIERTRDEQGAKRKYPPGFRSVACLLPTDFPGAESRRRDGKAARAWRAVQEAYAA